MCLLVFLSIVLSLLLMICKLLEKVCSAAIGMDWLPAGAMLCPLRTLQGEKMVEMYACKMRQGIISKLRTMAESSKIKVGFAIILAEWIFCMIAFGQQSQKEYIYMGGKAVATESSAFTPPTIAIASPTSGSTYNTTANSITVAGTASDASGISAVTWINTRGGAGSCTGTTSWNCSGIGLLLGQNVLIISAKDNQNSFSTATLVVNYSNCSYSISPASASVSTTGGTGSVSITSGSGCSWSASSNAAWITITSGSSGSGNGTASYSVASNSGAARSGTLTVAGQAFTINQAGVCTYSLNPTSANLPYSASGGNVSVTAAASCSWTSSSNDDWLIGNGQSGSGNGTAGYWAPANCLPDGRSGSLTVAGQNFSVWQDGYSNGQCTVDCMNNWGLPVQICGAACGCQ
jgi:hypothetical protein